MSELLKKIHLEKVFPFSRVPEYIGKTLDYILLKHHSYKEIPHYNKEKNTSLLEIRLDDATLSCIIRNNICIEAYKFSD